jgi:hypothetical protein
MRNEALHAAEGLGEGEVAQLLGEQLHRGRPASELEAHHRTEAELLRLRDRVARMRGQPRIVDTRYGIMTTQRLDNELRVGEMLRQARVQRAHAAQREVAVEWRAGNT